MKSIVFFDDNCPFCRRTINFLHRQDIYHRLQFASLEGKTAHAYLTGEKSHFRTLNTVVFLEPSTGKISIRGKAVFLILGKIGGIWGLVAWMHHLPWIDFFYKIIAHHRRKAGKMPPLEVKLLP